MESSSAKNGPFYSVFSVHTTVRPEPVLVNGRRVFVLHHRRPERERKEKKRQAVRTGHQTRRDELLQKSHFFLNLSLGGTSYSYVCPEPVLANIQGFRYRKVAPRNKRRFFPHQGVGDQAHDQRSPGLNQQLVARAQQARCPYPRPGLAQRLAPPRPAQNAISLNFPYVYPEPVLV